VLSKKLREVEVLPAEESRLLLGTEQAVDED